MILKIGTPVRLSQETLSSSNLEDKEYYISKLDTGDNNQVVSYDLDSEESICFIWLENIKFEFLPDEIYLK